MSVNQIKIDESQPQLCLWVEERHSLHDGDSDLVFGYFPN